MPLPDDILPEETPQPNFDGAPPPEDGIGAPENDPTQLVGGDGMGLDAPDNSFGEMTDIAAAEFDAKNPEPSIGSELPPNLDMPVPPAQPSEPSAPAQPVAPQSYKDRQAERREKAFQELKQRSDAEFARKQGKAPAAAAPAVKDDKEAFGEAVNAYRSESHTEEDGSRDNSNPVQEFVAADMANRNEMGELLAAHARQIDQHTRFLETQRL
jgi:hypothetical protein